LARANGRDQGGRASCGAADVELRLSVVIPCYNEIGTIDGIIDAVNNSPYRDKEIIIVDDCSSDGTREKLKDEIEPSGRVAKVLYHEVNQGKGAALRTGIAWLAQTKGH
jgi:glycosyltransferase involved in cell wall biosynthesis